MVLRPILLAFLLAALTAAATSAQSPRASEPTLTATFAPAATAALRATVGLRPAAPPAAQRGALVACTDGQLLDQSFSDVNAPTTTAGPQFGQSLTAPCDGFLTAVAVGTAVDAAGAGASYTLAFYTLEGEGPAGATLDAVAYTFTNPAASGIYLTAPLPLADAVAVTAGQTYTVLFQVLGGSGAQLRYATTDPYAGGQQYRAPGASPYAAVAEPGNDLRFRATFAAAVTATTPALYNPTGAEGDGAGWRLLSAPVSGVSITDLAAQNLVQGLRAGFLPAQYPAQFPLAGVNVLTGYAGSAFAPPISTGDVVQPGRGFFWHLYDLEIDTDPTIFGGGTSDSHELTGFAISATGPTPVANVARAFATTDNGAYMLGNPFNAPFQLSGVTQPVGGGTLSTVFSVWDPSVGSYVTLGPADTVAPWQGFFAGAPGATSPTFTYSFGATSPSATPPFYGRSPAMADAGIRFRLNGTTAAGAATSDLATQVRFLPDALAGADRHDGVKLLPPGATYALLAPVGDAGGTAIRLSVNSLPEGAESVSVPLAFLATDGGTFTLTWEPALGDRRATLRDLATGAVVDLATATDYTFTAEATDWTDRFVLDVMPGNVVAGESGPAAVRVGTFAPNPATGATRLSLAVDAAQTVRATIVDALGREVAVVFDAAVAPGADVTVAVETGRLSPGTYVVRVAGATFAETRRLTVVR